MFSTSGEKFEEREIFFSSLFLYSRPPSVPDLSLTISSPSCFPQTGLPKLLTREVRDTKQLTHRKSLLSPSKSHTVSTRVITRITQWTRQNCRAAPPRKVSTNSFGLEVRISYTAKLPYRHSQTPSTLILSSELVSYTQSNVISTQSHTVSHVSTRITHWTRETAERTRKVSTKSFWDSHRLLWSISAARLRAELALQTAKLNHLSPTVPLQTSLSPP